MKFPSWIRSLVATTKETEEQTIYRSETIDIIDPGAVSDPEGKIRPLTVSIIAKKTLEDGMKDEGSIVLAYWTKSLYKIYEKPVPTIDEAIEKFNKITGTATKIKEQIAGGLLPEAEEASKNLLMDLKLDISKSEATKKNNSINVQGVGIFNIETQKLAFRDEYLSFYLKPIDITAFRPNSFKGSFPILTYATHSKNHIGADDFVLQFYPKVLTSDGMIEDVALIERTSNKPAFFTVPECNRERFEKICRRLTPIYEDVGLEIKNGSLRKSSAVTILFFENPEDAAQYQKMTKETETRELKPFPKTEDAGKKLMELKEPTPKGVPQMKMDEGEKKLEKAEASLTLIAGKTFEEFKEFLLKELERLDIIVNEEQRKDIAIAIKSARNITQLEERCREILGGDIRDWCDVIENFIERKARLKKAEAQITAQEKDYNIPGKHILENARVSENARVYGNAKVSGDAKVSGNAEVSGDARVFGNADVFGDAVISGNAIVYGSTRIYENAKVSGSAEVFEDADVSENAIVSGNAKVSGRAVVFGNAKVSRSARVYGRAFLDFGEWTGIVQTDLYLKALRDTLDQLKAGKTTTGIVKKVSEVAEGQNVTINLESLEDMQGLLEQLLAKAQKLASKKGSEPEERFIYVAEDGMRFETTKERDARNKMLAEWKERETQGKQAVKDPTVEYENWKDKWYYSDGHNWGYVEAKTKEEALRKAKEELKARSLFTKDMFVERASLTKQADVPQQTTEEKSKVPVEFKELKIRPREISPEEVTTAISPTETMKSTYSQLKSHQNILESLRRLLQDIRAAFDEEIRKAEVAGKRVEEESAFKKSIDDLALLISQAQNRVVNFGDKIVSYVEDVKIKEVRPGDSWKLEKLLNKYGNEASKYLEAAIRGLQSQAQPETIRKLIEFEVRPTAKKPASHPPIKPQEPLIREEKLGKRDITKISAITDLLKRVFDNVKHFVYETISATNELDEFATDVGIPHSGKTEE